MTQNYIPFPDLVAEIENLCRERVTGTLFIATQGNRSAQMMIEDGEIVFVYFFNKRGKEALKLMLDIKAGRHRFQPGGVSRRLPLPSTDAILHFLATGGKALLKKEPKQLPKDVLSQEQKNILETCLAGFIGPMAGIICDDHLDKAANLQEAIDSLASEIPSAEQAKKFKEMATGQLA